MTSLKACKTYPSENFNPPIKVMQVSPKKTLPKIEELEPIVVEDIEQAFQCKKINPSERAVATYTFSGNVNGFKIDESNFPSIDRSESEATKKTVETIHAQPVPSRRSSKADSNIVDGNAEKKTPKEWKREKTFDGCPIYRVIKHFIPCPPKNLTFTFSFGFFKFLYELSIPVPKKNYNIQN